MEEVINMQKYNKAIVALFAPIVLYVLASFLGVTGDMSVAEAVEVLLLGVLTGFGVYQVPNRG